MRISLLPGLTLLLLAACDAPAPSTPSAQALATETVETATAETTPAAAPTEPAEADPAPPDPPDGGTVAGEPAADVDDGAAVDRAIDEALGDHRQYRAVIEGFQQAVAAHDADAAAELVDYPISVTIDGGDVTLDDANAFARRYDEFMTPAITTAITSQKYEELFVNYKGVMFGDGQVWVSGICSDTACDESDVRVVAIQSGP
jgi:hypothetical protein